jgi:hypothetical protein
LSAPDWLCPKTLRWVAQTIRADAADWSATARKRIEPNSRRIYRESAATARLIAGNVEGFASEAELARAQEPKGGQR